MKDKTKKSVGLALGLAMSASLASAGNYYWEPHPADFQNTPCGSDAFNPCTGGGQNIRRHDDAFWGPGPFDYCERGANVGDTWACGINTLTQQCEVTTQGSYYCENAAGWCFCQGYVPCYS